ncbi:Crp/Fnr family transcriptional regulator [Seongchinamella unica]|uniref:Crp/Fnr family transcriptional regulator n=1 Tax=Seongchinamella unica TaxID=2547392 RepID=A0A4R5LQM9_9GAMM|nr:Crp/Fnr family transcriptional regulator [Seongchinamella unica]TDG12840.1 Crp/Fnr family transcriptional regulator [Seongchinamella unica]
MRVIPHMHAFVSELSPEARQAFEELSVLRRVGKGEAVYRQGDKPNELYQLVEGRVRLCNYSLEGREVVSGEFQPGDCFGEMGLIDGLPRVSHAIASCDSAVRVLSRAGFDELTTRYPEVDRKIALMMCHRVRYLYALNEEASELTLHQRVARCVLRMAYSRDSNNPERELFIAISQEELGQMLGASRQSINKELKALVCEGIIELRYGRIYIQDLERLKDQYEYLLAGEPITPGYQQTT